MDFVEKSVLRWRFCLAERILVRRGIRASTKAVFGCEMWLVDRSGRFGLESTLVILGRRESPVYGSKSSALGELTSSVLGSEEP